MDIWEKLYFRAQSLFIFLQKKRLSKAIGLSSETYRIDLLKTIFATKGSIQNIDVLLDVGSNEGEFTKIFQDTYHPQLTICVEPNVELNKAILDNTQPYETIILNMAVSKQIGEMPFHFHSDTQMSSLFQSDPDLLSRDFGEDDGKKIYTKMLPVTTLDLLFDSYKSSFVNKRLFLKIDTQGNELDVLKGGKNALKSVDYILLEYMFQSPYLQRYDFNVLIDLLNQMNFECKGPMHISYRSTGEAGAVLFLFSNKDRPC